jgi:hypothetical protein
LLPPKAGKPYKWGKIKAISIINLDINSIYFASFPAYFVIVFTFYNTITLRRRSTVFNFLPKTENFQTFHKQTSLFLPFSREILINMFGMESCVLPSDANFPSYNSIWCQITSAKAHFIHTYIDYHKYVYTGRNFQNNLPWLQTEEEQRERRGMPLAPEFPLYPFSTLSFIPRLAPLFLSLALQQSNLKPISRVLRQRYSKAIQICYFGILHIQFETKLKHRKVLTWVSFSLY